MKKPVLTEKINIDGISFKVTTARDTSDDSYIIYLTNKFGVKSNFIEAETFADACIKKRDMIRYVQDNVDAYRPPCLYCSSTHCDRYGKSCMKLMDWFYKCLNKYLEVDSHGQEIQ